MSLSCATMACGKLELFRFRAGIGFHRLGYPSSRLTSPAICSYFVLMKSRDKIRRFTQPWKVEEGNSETLVITDTNGVEVGGFIIAQPAPDTLGPVGLPCSDKDYQFR